MRSIRITGENKYFKTDVVCNDDYIAGHQYIVDIILSKKIKSIDIGFHYHYITIKSPMKIYKHRRHDHKNIVFKTESIRFEAYPNDWREIECKRNEVIVEGQGYSMTIKFEKEILSKFKEAIKCVEDKEA